MDLTCLLMAGGRGSRLEMPVEKPMAKICGRPMIQWVIDAVQSTSEVSNLVVVVSAHTPATSKFVRRMEIEIFETPGKGYVEDLRSALEVICPHQGLVVSSDLPLLTPDVISRVVRSHLEFAKPSLSLVAKAEAYIRLGFRPDLIFELSGVPVTPVGLNILDGSRIDIGESEQAFVMAEDAVPVLNVNRKAELEKAEAILRTRLAEGP